MATLKTVLHSKVNTKGIKKYRIALRLTVNRKRSYYYLGQEINPVYWDENSEKVRKSHSKHRQLNRLIRKKYDQIEDVIFEMDSSKQSYSAKQIIDSIRNNVKGKTFFDLANEHIQDLIKGNKHNRAISDRSKVNRIREYINNRDLHFEEIDQNFLKKMKIHLMSKNKLSERSIMNIYVLIRLIYNIAIRQNLVDQKFYPFGKEKIRIKYPQTIKIGLDENEIRRIEKLNLKQGSKIWHTRNVFMFSFYLAGIRISDVLRMRWDDIKADRLYYRMSKNNKADSLKVSDRVMKIISFYK